MDKVSVVYVHFAMNEFRSQTMRESIASLIKTAPKAEIIVVDNGGSEEDSNILLNLVNVGDIACYIKNRKNMHFGFARNQGLAMASGEYIVISDNDILYKQGWLEKCLAILKAYPNYGVTPLKTDRQHRNHNYWCGDVEFDGETFLLNYRAGSNCWMMTREEFLKVGTFIQHHIAGSHWADKFVNTGHKMITMEKNPLATDTAFKRGYNFKEKIKDYYL